MRRKFCLILFLFNTLFVIFFIYHHDGRQKVPSISMAFDIDDKKYPIKLQSSDKFIGKRGVIQNGSSWLKSKDVPSLLPTKNTTRKKYFQNKLSSDRMLNELPNYSSRLTFSSTPINNLCENTKTYKPHAKILSYCSFGKNPYYSQIIPKIIGYKRNSSFYKDWIIRIYHDGHIQKDILVQINEQEDVQLCDGRDLPRYGDLSFIYPMYWRFVPIADPSVDVFCSRDLDSTLLLREEDAVKEFMGSGAILHTMRDHPFHHIAILGGMWCYKNKLDRGTGRYYLERIIEDAIYSKTQEDQRVLNNVVWRHASKKLYKVMQHDSYNCKRFKNSRPFPKQRRADDYHVGRPGHWRTTKGIDLKKYVVCPIECRPSYGKDWEYC